MEQQILLQRIERLEKEITALKDKHEVHLSDEAALIILKARIQELKAHGKKSVDVIQPHEQTSLPVVQITKLMHKLETEGVVYPNEWPDSRNSLQNC